MITKNDLPDLLKLLGFKKHGSTFSKTIGTALLAVDISKERIIYPESEGLVINESQTCNFSQSENFVVLECVHRLFEKGYTPANIELEPKWKLGRGASGGRADILVRDNTGKPLLIIECKTAGAEFNRAWKKTLQDGDQLFSYAHQISETQFLCLYTSDLEGGALTYTSHIIAHRDNNTYLDDNPGLKGFKTAGSTPERFAIWRDTYKFDYTTKGIFEANIQTYQIGKSKYGIDDLCTISANDQQKKYHEFATILRQHNVSGRENAFDKLVNLLLCKLVDETLNPQELKFYWKGVAYDSHFDLFDRLQQLYKDGMGKFLGEPITYIDRDAVRNAMRFIRQNPDATQKAVWHLFLQQKFFTNNDFSFIDVHNEKLFYQNADVLLKVIQMWQDIKLTNEDGNSQFLGDLFEGFLDQGVKQSEGQYFTPLPICRFIIMSLPLHTLVAQHASPPKVIDYACGAGHFLTELARQLKPLVAQSHAHADITNYHKAIIGIEKEYRLSKVAKVAAFMHGQRDIAICYGDALVKAHPSHPQIADHSFDILVATPPYSVKGFLETLPETERAAYELTDTIDKLDTNNSIECFFIERAKQLLKTSGIATIILPASILSNGNGTYIKTREILLRYFDIVAIAEFGSGTFGKTGTNTVTLFLRRKPTAPDTAEHYRGRVDEWFKGCDNSKRKQVIYKDADLIDRYAAHIGVPAADYKTLLQGDAHGPWCKADYFDAYTNVFNDSAEIKNLYKQKKFNSLSEAEQDAEIDRRYLAFVHAVERDKLYYFVLASNQQYPVLIIKSPSETKAQKNFLGYDWSSAKGDEGIKLIKDSHGRHLTPLYDETNRDNTAKLNYSIAANFNGSLASIPPALQDVARTVSLVDMLDFSRPIFEKQLNLQVKGTSIKSKWPLLQLGAVCSLEYGKPLPEANRIPGPYPVMGSNGRVGFHNEFLVQGPAIVIGRKGSAGEVVWEEQNCFPIDTTFYAKTSRSDVNLYYLFQALKVLGLEELRAGVGVPGLNRNDAYKLLIPMPPAATQQQIVADCKVIDGDCEKAQTSIEQVSAKIHAAVEDIYLSAAPRLEIDKLAIDIQYGINEAMNEGGVGYKIFRMNEVIRGRMVDNGSMKCANINSKEFAKYKLNKGDLLFIRSNGSLEHIGKVGLFDLDGDYCYASYLVRIAPDSSKVLPRYLSCIMNSETFRKGMIALAVKSGGTNNINATKMRNIKVPVPPLSEQKTFVVKIDALEKQIAEAQTIIDGAAARKQAILQKYL